MVAGDIERDEREHDSSLGKNLVQLCILSLREVFITIKTFLVYGLFGVVDGRNRRVVPKLLDAIGSQSGALKPPSSIKVRERNF